MQNQRQLKNWFTSLEKHTPLVMAGPCSAETPEQVLSIAHQIKDSGVSVFRAGIWKPRTRPGGFEGVGEIGLPWLEEVKKQTNLLLATEVATPRHVELALKHNIDILWIGARTTVNPFAVQELAESLRGTDKIVLIKNPVNPDLALWMGAIERFYRCNLNNLGAIHRGFSTYQKTDYRNVPQWQIPIELQNLLPDLPLICDPSHITGNRDKVAQVAQQAMNLNYNGLMIETHITPEKAWSDANQQVTPEMLKTLLKNLHYRKAEESSLEYNRQLQQLRSQIDSLDENLLEILEKRMNISEEIGELKQQFNVAVYQQKRWQTLLQKITARANEKGVAESFIVALYHAIHQESIARQEKMLNDLN